MLMSHPRDGAKFCRDRMWIPLAGMLVGLIHALRVIAPVNCSLVGLPRLTSWVVPFRESEKLPTLALALYVGDPPTNVPSAGVPAPDVSLRFCSRLYSAISPADAVFVPTTPTTPATPNPNSPARNKSFNVIAVSPDPRAIDLYLAVKLRLLMQP